MTTITGSPAASSAATVPTVSVIEVLLTATTAVCGPSGPATPCALTRKTGAEPGTSTAPRCARWPSPSGALSGARGAPGEASTTRPAASRI